MAMTSYREAEASSSSNEDNNNSSSSDNNILTAIKLIAATALFYSAGTSFSETYQQHLAYKNAATSANNIVNDMPTPSNHIYANTPVRENGRRLSETNNISKKNPPSYMKDLMDELAERTKLMTETPPEEVKYWFEYTGPLQVSLIGYRFVSYFACWWLYVYV